MCPLPDALETSSGEDRGHCGRNRDKIMQTLAYLARAGRSPAVESRSSTGSCADAPHAEISAGILAFRRKPALEVLLAHPGGPFWAKKDDGVWTIPKGLVEPGDDLVATARREFTEETNLTADGRVGRAGAG